MAYAPLRDDYEYPPDPGVGSAWGHGWRQLWPNFLMLILFGVVYLFVASGTITAEIVQSIGFSLEDDFGIGIGIGMLAWLFSVIYGIFIMNPVSYGLNYVYLKAARDERLDIKDLFEAFYNYVHAVLANILVGIIVFCGFMLLIIPGIVFACKLVFVPYLIVDRKMSVLDAIQESWRLTSGHAFTVFLMALCTVPVFILGFMCLFVGVIVSIMWTKLAFASLYYAVAADDDALAADYYRP